MSSEQPRRSRESSGASSAPLGSTAAIIIAIVAVVAGFLILREIRSDDSGEAAVPETTTATTVDPALTVPTTVPESTTTVPTMTYDGATAVVANASTVNGAAGVLTTALSGKGFTLAEATNASEKRAETVVYYVDGDTAALAVGTSIASLLGAGTTVQPMPTPPPVQDAALAEGVTVLVLLGSDKANLTLDAMAATTTTVAGATTTVPAIAPTTTAPPA